MEVPVNHQNRTEVVAMNWPASVFFHWKKQGVVKRDYPTLAEAQSTWNGGKKAFCILDGLEVVDRYGNSTYVNQCENAANILIQERRKELHLTLTLKEVYPIIFLLSYSFFSSFSNFLFSFSLLVYFLYPFEVCQLTFFSSKTHWLNLLKNSIKLELFATL